MSVKRIKHDYWNKLEMSPWEKLYHIEIFKGLWLTFSIAAKNLWTFAKGKKGALTVYYPEEIRLDYAKRFRGRHYLTKTETGRPKCITCMMCKNICPAIAIAIESEASPEGDTYSPKMPKTFSVDLSKCIFCGFCVEICPKDAIHMDSKTFNLTSDQRAGLILNKEQLLEYNHE